MSLKPQLSFSSGELDPVLHDRVTLERFQNALATARNVVIGKSGTIKSRFSRFNFAATKYDNSEVKIYSPKGTNVFLEFGFNPADSTPYVNLYNLNGTLIHTYVTSGLDHLYFSDLTNLHCSYSGDYVYVFEGSNTTNQLLRLQLSSPYQARSGSEFISRIYWPAGNPSVTVTTNGSGYKIDYAFTIVKNGEESEAFEMLNSAYPTLKKCVAAGEESTIVIDYAIANPLFPYQEVRVYQRPSDGSAYGYLGRTTKVYIESGRNKFKFVDVGADPDYTNGLQTDIVKDSFGTSSYTGDVKPTTGTIYQQRLLLGGINLNQEAILASRPGYKTNFYKDFPYGSDSALNFKAGSDGNAKVLRMIEKEGLVVFTTIGVFVSTGVLSPQNLGLEKRGNWLIDESIPPLIIPGGLFFVDKPTNSIRQLVYSQEASTYESTDITIFSDHLFKERTITSWCYQDGSTPLIIVTFSDGKFATLTYNSEHQMMAWTRHDSKYPIEQVEGTSTPDTSIFVVNKNGQRYIELTVPRVIPSNIFTLSNEIELTGYGQFMDSMSVKSDKLNDWTFGGDYLYLFPQDSLTWDGLLDLAVGGSSGSIPFTTNVVGDIFRFFNPKDKTRIDLEIVSRISDTQVVVQPSELFPEEYGSNRVVLYRVHTTITGLTYLEGEEVSVMCDGDIVSSPNNDNDQDELSVLTVTGGVLTLPYPSAITVVGRPITVDIKTLNISTVEQSPTTIESLNVNKIYVRVINSRGVFVDNQFPEDKTGDDEGSSVKEMQTLEEYYVPSATSIIGNRQKPKTSKRIEVTLPGSWENQGQMAIRQVDPIHFELLSIIADIEILKRRG